MDIIKLGTKPIPPLLQNFETKCSVCHCEFKFCENEIKTYDYKHQNRNDWFVYCPTCNNTVLFWQERIKIASAGCMYLFLTLLIFLVFFIALYLKNQR